MIAEQYEAHSQFYNVILEGLETESLTDDEPHHLD